MLACLEVVADGSKGVAELDGDIRGTDREDLLIGAGRSSSDGSFAGCGAVSTGWDAGGNEEGVAAVGTESQHWEVVARR